MSAALRKALFWLLMLALPLQGVAAGVMPIHAAGQTESSHSSMQQVAGDTAAAGMRMSAAGVLDDCASLAAGCEHSRAQGAFKCGLSAACALVAAPGLERLKLADSRSSQAPLAPYLQSQVAFQTGAPERPPRLLA